MHKVSLSIMTKVCEELELLVDYGSGWQTVAVGLEAVKEMECPKGKWKFVHREIPEYEITGNESDWPGANRMHFYGGSETMQGGVNLFLGDMLAAKKINALS